jgi:hypothetical protein
MNSIPDHNDWQGMPWKHTEGLPTLRDGQRACIQDFQTCTTFAQQTGPRTKSFRGKFPSPLFLLWWVWFDPKPVWEQKKGETQTKTCISTPKQTQATFSGREWYKSSPPLTPLTPNSLIFMSVKLIYWNHLGDLRCVIQERGINSPFLGEAWLGWVLATTNLIK